MKPGTSLVANSGPLTLSNRLGSGGEGEVFAVHGDASTAVKLYHSTLAASRERKIVRMVNEGLATKTPLAAFPKSVVRDNKGSFVGFTMPLVSDHIPVFDVFGPGSRKKNLPSWDYRQLLRVASNLARSVASVHGSGCVIGDINSNGILVSKSATVVLIDTDSFQIDPTDRALMCHVGVPEYTPPELQGMTLTSRERTVQHDAFGLATILFQLLFIGRHPFQGTFRGGDKPMADAIKEHRYVYSRARDTGMQRPPAMHMIDDMPDGLLALFEAAFSAPTHNSRPTPADWAAAISSLEGRIEKCPKSKSHFGLGASVSCHWCRLERENGLDLFPASLADLEGLLATGDDKQTAAELDRIWNLTASIPQESLMRLDPVLILPRPPPTAAAAKAKHPISAYNPISVVALIGSVIACAALPAAFLLWAIFFVAALSNLKRSGPENGTFLSAHSSAHELYQLELDKWRSAIHLKRLIDSKSELLGIEQTLRAHNSALQNKIKTFYDNSQARQMQEHLEQFPIRRARINKVTTANAAALISYGIETAADIEHSLVMEVSGIGPVKARELVAWRQSLERTFQSKPSGSPEEQRALAKLKIDHASEGKQLVADGISKGRTLIALNGQVETRAKTLSPELQSAAVQLQQAVSDLEHLGIAVPKLSARTLQPPKAPARPKPATPAPSPKAVTKAATPRAASPPKTSCPVCSSAMVLRTARRGAGAGRQFWGCSTYPRCRGTRPY